MNELRSLETRHGSFSVPESSTSGRSNDPVGEKRAKVAATRTKAEEEKAKHEKAVNITRSMTMTNLQMGLPHVFQALAGFSSLCTQAYELLYHHLPDNDEPGKGKDRKSQRLLN
ncbi:hypothetical protein MLD38_005376 [Melastoma candidum]|nr:hypothetical protein MLD38_005376 [Melastoma candidum]